MLILAFLLVVVVDNEVVSDEKMLFKNVYRCNLFADAIETGKTRYRDRRFNPQQKVTAYCIPRRVENTETFYD